LDIIERVLMDFDPKRSLAFTHTSRGIDKRIFGGLLG
jgi:hypothetical protein